MSRGLWSVLLSSVLLPSVLLPSVLSCSVLSCSARYPCLSGSIKDPYSEREDLLLLQREYERTESAEPAIGARILEAMPRLFPDLSARSDAPECSPQMVDELESKLAARPLPWNNATLHYLAALGNVHDTTDVMDRKATILLSLATIADDDVSPYEMSEGESGERPDAAYLRARATAELVHSNLYLNDKRVRRFLIEKALSTTSARERLMLLRQTRMLPWQPGEEGLAAKLLEDRLQAVESALDKPTEPVGFELLLEQLRLLSQDNSGSSAVRPMLERIIASDGALPVTEGQGAWAHDLAVRARQCMWDLNDTQRSLGPDFMNVPFPRRQPVAPFEGLFDDLTTLVFSGARSAAVRHPFARVFCPQGAGEESLLAHGQRVSESRSGRRLSGRARKPALGPT